MIDYFNSGTGHYFETEPYSRILSNIGEGQKNAIHKDDLIKRTDIPDRLLRKRIEYLRQQGVVIIADGNGFYFPATQSELEAYVHKVEKTARSTFYTLKSARRLLKEIKGTAASGRKATEQTKKEG